MFIPSGFLPSGANKIRSYDVEGRLHESRPGPGGNDGGIAESNSLFSTEAEEFGSCAPFLKKNKIKDARRRNYIIQPGGACIYFESERRLEDPYDNGRVQFTAPSEQESFGHNSQPNARLLTPGGISKAAGK